jgi:transposase
MSNSLRVAVTRVEIGSATRIVTLQAGRGLISSRAIERACRQNVLFMAISGDTAPSYTHIAKFMRELGEQIKPLFAQVLLLDLRATSIVISCR